MIWINGHEPHGCTYAATFEATAAATVSGHGTIIAT